MSTFELSEVEQAELPDRVLAILGEHRGARNAITGRRIAQRLGYKDDRKARIVIQQLIANGHTIAASVGSKDRANPKHKSPLGYYMVETRAEADAYEAVLRSRAMKTLARLRDFRIAMGRVFGTPMQPLLFELDEERT